MIRIKTVKWEPTNSGVTESGTLLADARCSDCKLHAVMGQDKERFPFRSAKLDAEAGNELADRRLHTTMASSG